MMLKDVQDHSRATWKCLLKEDVNSLGMAELGHTEGGLLIQAEYETAFKELCSKEQKKDICHGIILNGQ